jgi:hypothetical protein
MAFDEGLAQRLSESTGELPVLVEKRVFGGLAFLHRGNMLVGVIGDDLIARVGPDATESALTLPSTSPAARCAGGSWSTVRRSMTTPSSKRGSPGHERSSTPCPRSDPRNP